MQTNTQFSAAQTGRVSQFKVNLLDQEELPGSPAGDLHGPDQVIIGGPRPLSFMPVRCGGGEGNGGGRRISVNFICD